MRLVHLVVLIFCSRRCSARLATIASDGLKAFEPSGRRLKAECKEAPNPRAKVRFPTHLMPVTNGPPMYSGYINVTTEDYLFYWMAEAEPSVASTAPVLLWSNGGPGCTSMEGALTEIGPWQLHNVKEEAASGAATGRLSRSAYAWTAKVHLLMVDQPRYTGYSVGSGPQVTNSEAAAQDIVSFIRGWRLHFPEHAHRPWVFASESYGGRWVPSWAEAVMAYNAQGPSDPIALAGALVGNGYMESFQDDPALLLEYGRREGFWTDVANKPHSFMVVENKIQHVLGYTPNMYDYRVKKLACCNCGQYNYSLWASWLLRQDVRQALHTCGSAGEEVFGTCAAGCREFPGFDAHPKRSFIEKLSKVLRAGIPAVLYYGKQDMRCHYVGGYAAVEKLDWPGKADFLAAGLKDFGPTFPVQGQHQSGGGLAYFQFEGSGHMVPHNSPPAAFHALQTLLDMVAPSNNSIPIMSQADVGNKAEVLAENLPNIAASIGMGLMYCAACGCMAALLGLVMRRDTREDHQPLRTNRVQLRARSSIEANEYMPQPCHRLDTSVLE